MKLIPLLLFVILISALVVSAQQFPKPINYASDFANVIDPEWEAAINTLGEGIERNNTSQIFVVAINNTNPYTAKEYATRLFNDWKIGQKGKDNGVLILLAFEPERRIEIETGYGVEGVLPDSKVGNIRREYTPLLTEGKFGEGLYKIAKSIGDVISGSGEFSGSEENDLWGNIFGFFIWVILIIIVFIAIGFAKMNASAKCPNCKIKMEVVKTKQSGDYIITEFVCKKCGKKITKKKRKSHGGYGLIIFGDGGWGGSGGGGFGGGGGGGSGGGGSGGGF